MKTMNSFSDLSILRYGMTSFFARGSCWVVFLLAFFVPFVGPWVTPWEENPPTFKPAQAQTAWIFAWFMVLTWLPIQIAAISRGMHQTGVFEFFSLRHRQPLKSWLQMTLLCLIWTSLFAILAFVFCVAICMPGEKMDWVILNGEYALLFILAILPSMVFCFTLATRTDPAIAYIIPLSWTLVGVLGTEIIKPIALSLPETLQTIFWVCTPHHHYADLTSRLVFKLGPMLGKDLMFALIYFALQWIALLLLSMVIFRENKTIAG
jgi:hypothetical protein